MTPVLLKGGALGITVYGDAGARPMEDIDILVRPHQALHAGGILAGHGFVPQYRFDEQRVRTLNAVNFSSTTSPGHTSGAIDLHWHLLPEPCDESCDEAVHTRAKPALLRDLPVHVLDPTDELLLACAHGIRWNLTPPIRWAADAHLLVTRLADTIDWARLVDTARRRGLTLPVRTALRYIASSLATPVPDAVLRQLEETTPRTSERLEFWLRVSPLAEPWFGDDSRRWCKLEPRAAPSPQALSVANPTELGEGGV